MNLDSLIVVEEGSLSLSLGKGSTHLQWVAQFLVVGWWPFVYGLVPVYVQNACQFMRNSKRRRLTVEDMDMAIHSMGVEVCIIA